MKNKKAESFFFIKGAINSLKHCKNIAENYYKKKAMDESKDFILQEWKESNLLHMQKAADRKLHGGSC